MIVYDPLPSVRAFHESDSRIKVLWGPLGTGKSSAGLWEYILQCQESEIPLDGMVIRGSYRELRDSTLKTFMRWFGSLCDWRESDSMALIHLPHPRDPKTTLQHILRFRSLSKPDDAKKVQSFEGAFVMLDEVAPTFASTGQASEGIPIEIQEYTNARLRHAFNGKSAHRYTQVIVANPPNPTHWLYRHFLSKDPAELAKKRGGVSIHFIPRSENVKNLPDDYYEILCDTFHDPDLVRRLVEGEIVPTYSGERCYPEAKDRVHVVNTSLEPMKGLPLILGFDYGMTPATLVTQLLPTGQWRIMSEVTNFNVAFEIHLDQLRQHLHDHYLGFEYRCWGDPSGDNRAPSSPQNEQTCVQLAQKYGFDIRPGLQNPRVRKEAMKQRFLRNAANGEPGILVSRPGCPLFSEGVLGAYRYHKNANGEIGTQPLKNNVSHIVEAGEYVATREFVLSPQASRERRPDDVPKPHPPDPFKPDSHPKRPSSWLSS